MQEFIQKEDEQANCIFCQIIASKIPSKKLVDNSFCIAVQDLNPQAPTHILIIPKKHIPELSLCEDPNLLGNLLIQSKNLAKEQELSQGFRLVINSGKDGGQTVHHLHIHLLGNRPMQWPPG